MSKYLMGIDIGTSGTKTVLFDVNGNIIGNSTIEYDLIQHAVGWAEQRPEDWWNATLKTIKAVMEKTKVDPKNIKGIGLTGQMHSLVLLDKDNQVQRPSIIWADQRTAVECEEISSIVGEDKLIDITANPAITGFTASKIMWVKKFEPHIYSKTRKILLAKDYIRFMLTGQFATDVSDASGMQLMDIRKRNWSDEILGKLEIDRELLAEVYESQEITGYINRYTAQATGLKEGTPVVGGAGDQASGAIGNGIVTNKVASSTIGTSGVVFAFTDDVIIDKLGRIHTFCHAIPNTWHVMGVTQGAGLSLRWCRDNLCGSEKEVAKLLKQDVYEIMNLEAEKVKAGSDGLIYLPYLMGERTPHLDPWARGVFFGLAPMHTKGHIIRSIMEGVSYSLKDCMEVIKEIGIEVEEIRLAGGGNRSPLWRQMQSDMFEKDVVVLDSTEGPALGAALLAGTGVGIYQSVQQACEKVIKKKSIQTPNKDSVELYKTNYELYKRLYLSLKDNFEYANLLR